MNDHDPTDHENGHSEHDLALHEIGAIAMHETEQEVSTIPEISVEQQETYVDRNPDSVYLLVCSDDRNLTSESAEALSSDGVESPDTALRAFGGAFGPARAIATVAAAQGSIDALNVYRGNFTGFVKDSSRKLEAAANIVPAVHSAHDNEGSSVELNVLSSKDIGCKYGANTQNLSKLNYSPQILAHAATVIEQLSGAPAQKLEQLAEASKKVEEIFSAGGEKDFNADREDLINLDLPIAIQEGNHATIDDGVKAIFSFRADKISNPRTANQNDIPAYNIDVTAECEGTIRANPELQLDPRTLVEFKVLDACSTLEALASGEGKHAADFKIERFGDYEASIAYLESLQATL